MTVTSDQPTPLPPDPRYVELFRVSKAYDNGYGQKTTVVEQFDLRMRRSDMVSLIGHSGCGKSTVLTMVAGLNQASCGSIAIAGREVSDPGPDRAVVFQSPCLLPWMTAMGNVSLAVDKVYPHATRHDRRELCEYYLAAVGLGDAMHRFPRELSGGMQQRVGIARAIAVKPRLLLLDEPFGRLDSLTRMELQDVILRILDAEEVTTLLVTHDVDEALYMSDRICMMTSGPRARIGQILELPFRRPRKRPEVLEHALYYDFRGCLVSFLQQQEVRPTTREDRTIIEHASRHVEVLTDTRSDGYSEFAPRHAPSELQAAV